MDGLLRLQRCYPSSRVGYLWTQARRYLQETHHLSKTGSTRTESRAKAKDKGIKGNKVGRQSQGSTTQACAEVGPCVLTESSRSGAQLSKANLRAMSSPSMAEIDSTCPYKLGTPRKFQWLCVCTEDLGGSVHKWSPFVQNCVPDLIANNARMDLQKSHVLVAPPMSPF